jgi:hypothetical protein
MDATVATVICGLETSDEQMVGMSCCDMPHTQRLWAVANWDTSRRAIEARNMSVTVKLTFIDRSPHPADDSPIDAV